MEKFTRSVVVSLQNEQERRKRASLPLDTIPLGKAAARALALVAAAGVATSKRGSKKK